MVVLSFIMYKRFSYILNVLFCHMPLCMYYIKSKSFLNFHVWKKEYKFTIFANQTHHISRIKDRYFVYISVPLYAFPD